MIFYHDKKHFLLIHLIRECDRLLCLNFFVKQKMFFVERAMWHKKRKNPKTPKSLSLGDDY